MKKCWKLAILQKFKQTFEKSLTNFCWNFEIWAVQRIANLVDLEKWRKMSIYLQKSASIQPRTGLSKFAKNYQFSKFPSFSRFPTSSKHRRGKKRTPAKKVNAVAQRIPHANMRADSYSHFARVISPPLGCHWYRSLFASRRALASKYWFLKNSSYGCSHTDSPLEKLK